MILWEILCGHGYETYLSYDEKKIISKIPLDINKLNDREKEICRNLIRKNTIKIKDGKIVFSYKQMMEVSNWFLQ